MIVRQFKKEDTLSVFNIWRECFTDDANYINNFINNCLPYTNTWVLCPDKETTPVSLVTVIPSYTLLNNVRIQGGYIFGVGTLIKHRGHSYSKHIIDTIFAHSAKTNLSYLLVKPAEERLYSLYKRMSFDKTIYKKVYKTSLPNRTNNCLNYKEINSSFHEYLKLREEHLCDTAFMWPEEILKYAASELFLRGGTLKFLKTDSGIIFFAAHPIEGDAETIKVIDHNIASISDLNIVKEYLNTQYISAKFLIFESSNSQTLLESYTETESALYKILDSSDTLPPISGRNLAYTME